MDIDADGKVRDQTKYRSLIGSLLYLTKKPDINFAEVYVQDFNRSKRKPHDHSAKRILRYLKGSQEVGLWYPKEGGFKLIGYSDSTIFGCIVDGRAPRGTCQMLGNKANFWFSKKQNSIATSALKHNT
ncbi:hypothetical protein DH2020_004618 [Rehmannia glutinosa]|uniref:Uncharacterized protein n=1 Tax=Rehmannia glutinosa TaxID=99300 RepID=A0ABR0XQ07_REHGL